MLARPRSNAAESVGASGQRTTIGNIPEEVLICIFELCLQVKPLNKPDALCRLRLTCRWWEQVIQRTPSFWSHVSSLHGLEWTELALQRSKTHLLTADVTGISNRAAISRIVQELPRTESLSILLPFRRYVQQSPDIFINLHQSPPPALKNLTMYSMEQEPHRWLIFNGQWAHLRSLQTPAKILDWDACKLSRLERLDIEGRGTSNRDIARLLQVFRCCPGLQYFRLWDPDPDPDIDAEPSPPSEVVTLPKLTTCIINCHTKTSNELLCRIQLPNLQHFEFREFSSWGRGLEDLCRLLDALTPIVEAYSVQQGNPENTVLYFCEKRILVLRCQLESLGSVGLRFELYIEEVLKELELEKIKESECWSILENGGMVVNEVT